jgi:hypothetical protein
MACGRSGMSSTFVAVFMLHKHSRGTQSIIGERNQANRNWLT